MNRLRLLTLVGTRPEVIKLSLTIAAADEHFEHVLVHTGQNYADSLNDVFFRDLSIRPPDVRMAVAQPSSAATIARIIEGTDDVLERVRPDAFLILGDTNSCLGALAAKRRKIPIFHMEAGNRCFDQRVPEEVNRRLLDHISDINLPYTEHARRNLLAEGLQTDRIIRTGSPMLDRIEASAQAIADSPALSRLGLQASGYIVASLHREENVDSPDRMIDLLEALAQLAKRLACDVIVSTHPRTRLCLQAVDLSSDVQQRLRFLDPFGFNDWMRLQKDALLVVSDSGTLTEEAAIAGFPAVMLREAHERPEGMDEGVVIRSDPSRLVAAALQAAHSGRNRRVPADYQVRGVAQHVVGIIQSYTDYVNRVVWHKH